MTVVRSGPLPLSLKRGQYGVIITPSNEGPRLQLLRPTARQSDSLDDDEQALLGAVLRLKAEPGFDEKCRRALELYFEPPQGTG